MRRVRYGVGMSLDGFIADAGDVSLRDVFGRSSYACKYVAIASAESS